MSDVERITVLSGGMGGAKFLQGLLHGIAAGILPGVSPDAEVTEINAGIGVMRQRLRSWLEAGRGR